MQLLPANVFQIHAVCLGVGLNNVTQPHCQAGDEPGAATRAYLRSAAQPAPRPVLALLAAAISNPAALESLNQRYTTWQRRLDHDSIPPHIATLVRCAIDGLWLAETFDLAAPNPATRGRMLAELEKLID